MQISFNRIHAYFHQPTNLDFHEYSMRQHYPEACKGDLIQQNVCKYYNLNCLGNSGRFYNYSFGNNWIK